MREGFRAGAFFVRERGGRGEGAGEAGDGVVVRICTNRENARMAAKRGDGEWMRTGGEPGERMGGEGVRKRAGEEIDGEGNREIHGERGPLREIAAGGRDGGESADGVGSWTSICMGRGCGKVDQKAA